MKIWLLALGEPIHTELEGEARLHRCGNLADLLAKRGHDVTWWTSNMDHVKKTSRSDSYKRIKISDNLHINILPAPLYKRNVSLKRIRHNVVSAQQFNEEASKMDAPDILVCAFPTIELSKAATDFGKKTNTPVIVDVRDFWPDIITELAPKLLHVLAKLPLKLLYDKTKSTFKDATAITGISQGAIDWALAHAGREKGPLDVPFVLAYDNKIPTTTQKNECFKFWDNLGVGGNPEQFIISYFGSFNHRIQLKPVIEAAKIISKDRPNLQVKFVLCGQGPTLKKLEIKAKKLPSVIFPGWINRPKIWTLLQRSSVGLLPYPATLDFNRSYPNKVGEYFSSGVPILSSVMGDMNNLIKSKQCGVTYAQNNGKSLANLICNLYDQPAQLSYLSFNAKSVFNTMFNSQIVYEDYCNYIEEISKLKLY